MAGRQWPGGGDPDRRLLMRGGAVIAGAWALIALLDFVGLPQSVTLGSLLLVILAVFAWSGIATVRADAAVFLVADRGVSPIRNGMGIAGEGLSLAMLLGIFGAVFASGHDGLVYLISLAAGLALVPLLFAAPLRASNATTLPELMALRFASPWPRLTTLIAVVLTCLLVAAAQLVALGHVGARLLGVPYATVVAAGAAVILVSASRGGMGAIVKVQPLLWTVTAAAVLVALGLVSMSRLGMPLAQFGYGTVIPEVVALEQAMVRRALAEARSLKPLLTPFVTLDGYNHLGIAAALMFGWSVMPHVLARAFVSPTGRAARRSFAWGLVFFAIVATALPALVVFAKVEMFALIGKGTRLEALPAWMLEAGQLGIIKICGVAAVDAQVVGAACRGVARHPGLLRLQDMAIDAELLLLALPRVTGLAFAVTALLGAGLLAAALASIEGPLMAVALTLSRDGLGSRVGSESAVEAGIGAARWMLGVAAALVALIALARPADALTLLVWGAALAAAGLFPAMLLAVWWRRASAAGVVAGMFVGFGACLAYILGTRFFSVHFYDAFIALADVAPAAARRFDDLKRAWGSAVPGAAKDAAWAALDAHAQRIANWWGLRSTAAILLALPAGLGVAIIVSLLTRAPAASEQSSLAAWRRPLKE